MINPALGEFWFWFLEFWNAPALIAKGAAGAAVPAIRERLGRGKPSAPPIVPAAHVVTRR